jgi:VIT1/CCC1 family predicted Fe2+/Mn2+ transporter
MPASDPVQQSLENLRLERDATWLYERLAEIERDQRRASAFRTIASNERRHAEIWTAALERQGVDVPPRAGPRARVRVIAFLARLFGTRAVGDLVLALEGEEEQLYEGQSGMPEVAEIAADEREHAAIWRRLQATPDGRAVIGVADGEAGVAAGVAAAEAARSPQDIARSELWHKAGHSGTFRAVIFGVSDGLVSNLALVMGVAGAATEPRFTLLAGIAGLLAGAFSMAAGEYISMQSQRELFERQIELERAELRDMPEEELAELAAVYRSKGFTPDEAIGIARRQFRDPEAALSTLVREELGLDPDQLGSPVGAAVGSFVSFAVGAAIPVLPYLFIGGTTAFWVSIGASLLALFAVGAGVSLLTGRDALFSGLRQVAIGAGAAAVTYAVGTLIGVGVGV